MESAAIPEYGFACPCGQVVLDLRGSSRGDELCCPRCERVFRHAGLGEAPEVVSAPAARRRRTFRIAGAGAVTDGDPPPPPSDARLMAKYVMIWTGFIVVMFGLYCLFSLSDGSKTIDWSRVPWRIWAVAVPGAGLLGLGLWAAHTYFFIHRPKVRRARERQERAEREARKGAGARTKTDGED